MTFVHSSRRTVLALAALAVALGLSLVSFSTIARGSESVICSNYPTGTGDTSNCPPGPRHTLTRVETVGDYATCSGAWVTPPNDFYMGYACQGPASAHPYGAGTLLYGASHNHSGIFNVLNGKEFW